mgnify:CR=1 FL=1|tara:strand:+ start:1255 stop:1890 length:636 start_codon:yes stop_codon:yes gene_type:complete
MNRISIRNKKFKVGASEYDHLECVIVNAAPVQRMYYAQAYDPDVPQTPVCWSSDTDQPDPQVKDKQAPRCIDCKHDIRGSASSGGRACRYSQKLAVVIEDNLYDIYQLHVPANSIFGRAVGSHMPLQEYARFLSKNNTPSVSIFTKMYFDGDSLVPKIFFTPVKPLEETELDVVKEMINHPDTIKAITLDFSDVQETSCPFEKTEGFTIST